MPRAIKQAFVKFISLCPRGANRLRTLFKADGTMEWDALSKLNEQGELLAVVYAPNHVDAHGEYATADVIKDAAYGFMAKGAAIDIQHDGKKIDNSKAYVAETFIIQKGDERFSDWKDTEGKPVDLTGGWATLIKIEDKELRTLYREGKWNGVSMGGEYIRGSEDASMQKFIDAFLQIANKQPAKATTQEPETDMDEKTLSAALEKQLSPLTTAITDLVKTLKPKEEKPEGNKDLNKEEKPPVYRGKPDDEIALLKHEREMELFQLRKDADMETTEGIRSHREAVSDLKKKWREEDAEKEAAKRSNQGGDGNNGNSQSGGIATLNKQDQDLMNAGRNNYRELRGLQTSKK